VSFYARGVSPLVPADNRCATVNTLPSLTQQHHLEEVNINKIISRFNKTGVLGDGVVRTPRYADVSLFGDFSQAQQKIAEGRAAFAALPVSVRKLAGNDPMRLWEVLNNPENRIMLEKAGVLKAPEKPEPAKPEGQAAQ